ncbi:ATP-binding protein [Dinghuibacter silviterrae]|uniref:ATP-binding protein n=1 Tax=Dinghuibacter silviterrae TaxID=1539049 RepID=UPI0021D305FF|nr:ATP-binding protein [Dinghuibacter silviterrae]
MCGFANAQGGKIFIGMDDDGEVSGIDDYKRLMEDIPNKTVNHLGVMVDVNHCKKGDKHYLEIDVPVSSVPISYHGVYHYRSGSTKQELKGVSLQNWLLKKMGRHWEDIPASASSLNDLDQDSILAFLKRATVHSRIPNEARQYDIPALLENLHLLTSDGQPTQAAVLLFGKRPSQFVPTCTIKIGRFGKSEDELLFHDVIETNLISMPSDVLRKLTDRYIGRPISYKGLERLEPMEYPEPALREAILNAIVHKDYSSTWTFLRVYDDKIEIWNPGPLPEELTIQKLKGRHSSYPRNPHIAEVFFKAGYIEAWGRGTTNMIQECLAAGLPEPILEEDQGGVRVTFLKDIYTKEHLTQLGLSDRKIYAVLYIKEKGYITNSQYQKALQVSDRTALRDLEDLVQREVVVKMGERKSTRYLLKK